MAKIVEVFESMQNELSVKKQIVSESKMYQSAPPNSLGAGSPAVPRITTNQKVNAVAFNRHNTNTFTASTQSLANIRFKQLPFYEVVSDVMEPTTLVGNENCSLPLYLQKKGMREAIFNIKMFYEQINYISLNRDINKNEYLYQLQIRICDLESISAEMVDFMMPLDLQIRVNNKFCVLPPIASNKPGNGVRQLAMPIHCAQHLKLSPLVSNTITINWTPDEKSYVFGAFIVKKLSSEILLQKLFDKGVCSSNETIHNIIKTFSDTNHDVATTSYNFPLICPLGKKRMAIPAKSIKCDHLYCFDAAMFLAMNENKSTWLCPTCHNPCLYDDIRIQQYFLNVVQTVPESCESIQLLADGTWIMYEKNDEPVDCVEDSIVLDDREIENSTDVEKEANTKSKTVVLGLVDLLLSDNELSKYNQENEDHAANTVQYQQANTVQPRQAVTRSEQELIIVDSD